MGTVGVRRVVMVVRALRSGHASLFGTARMCASNGREMQHTEPTETLIFVTNVYGQTDDQTEDQTDVHTDV